ncbi:MAG TPA: HAMP domain-containing sensor histidine kinase [Anaerolineales bacterium]|nr:HAMP domain-containing sensor histidine kinase [Anaerolineales bacterium]
MLRSLRNRLIFTHVLPVLIIVPLTGAFLFYVLEARFLLPRLAGNLADDARLLAEVSQIGGGVWDDPRLFDLLLSRVRIDPEVRVMFLSPGGELLYSTDQADAIRLGEFLPVEGLEQARQGEETINTNYSLLRLRDALIDVLAPAVDPGGEVSGVVRVSYRSAALYTLFSQLRNLIVIVLVVGLLLGTLIGSILAISIGKPLQNVTEAIYGLAHSGRSEPLAEQGPDELRDLTRSVNVLVARLSGLEQARRQLLANLVHELGRPLGALRSAIQAFSHGAEKDPQLMIDLTSGMDEEAARMQHILEDLARLHDQVVGTLELARQPIRLGEWLPGVLIPWEQVAREKRLDWETHLPDNLPDVYADPVRLAQVVGNLVSNAIRYTPGGGGVSVSAGSQGNQTWVRVEDTGPGIPDEERERIFTPFYRGDRGRRIKEGMGLGLSIARDLAQAHGGRIDVESTPGAGSRFTVWLPNGSNQNE